MDEKLEKSLSLLEDVTRGIPSHSKLFKLNSVWEGRDVSMATSIFNESVMRSQKRKDIKLKKTDLRDMSISIAINQSEMSSIFDHSVTARFMDEDAITLSEQFQEVLDLHGTSLSVFDAILNFIEILNKAIYMENGNKETIYGLDNVVAGLEIERNTWLLIHALFSDREITKSGDDFRSQNYSCPLSEKDIIENLYKQDPGIRECQIIVDWLERVAREQCTDDPKVPHFTDPTVAWENTLHQMQSSSPSFASSRQLVSSLDPDAPARQNKPLHDVDQDDQYRLLTEVFKEIRMGRQDKAQELCLHCGQAWLAAALEGWRLYHDPNRNSAQAAKGTILEGEGNHQREVWKWVAWSICQSYGHVDSHDALERAIYGALCGHIDSLQPLCVSWEDTLWAYAKTSIDVRVEKEIRDNTLREYQALPDKYWNSYCPLEEIFSKLKATSELKVESHSISRIIQELVCLDRSSDLIETMSAYIDNSDQNVELIRFMAHIVLILRMLGRAYPNQQANNIIKAYVKVLTDENNANLIAFYTSKLDPEDQIDEYAIFLQQVTDVKRKLQCLQIAESQKLNVTAITHRVAQFIWRQSNNEVEDEGLSKETSGVDLTKINALDWMIFYSVQRADALVEANALIRNFISQGKIDAARKAHNKIPDDSIDVIMSQYDCQMDEHGRLQTDNLPARINSAVTEYLAYKAYLDAQEGFSDWFKMFHSRPSKGKVENLDDLTDFTKQVSLRENARVMNEKYESWKATIDHVTKTVKAQLYNVLVFPPRGWLLDIFTGESDKQRRTQLDALRSLCIPEIILLLHTLLHNMELYEDCLDLCSVIMSEEHQIYKVISKQGLKDFLEKLSNSCLELSCIAPDAFALAPPLEPARPLQLFL